MWAQRSTIVTPQAPAPDRDADGGGPLATPSPLAPVVELVSLWIHLDPVRRVPSLISQAEIDVYAEAAGERHFAHRLTHPRPNVDVSEAGAACEWVFRRTDTDLADHVNNAAYWEPLEEELLTGGVEPVTLDVELEFRTPAQPGPVRIVRDGRHRWLTEPVGGEVYASMLLRNAETTSGSN
jgi:hypothetical protein